MLNAVRVIFQNDFNRNVLTLVTGTGLAQLIPLAITPLLSRIYSPEQFGVLAMFLAIVSSLSVLATGRYELAIMLPREDADAINIAVLSTTINLMVSGFLILALWVFDEHVTEAIGNEALSAWLYFVPLSLLLNGIYLSLNYWSNRNKMYASMAQRRVLQSGSTAALQLGLGVWRAGATGLIIGNIFGQAVAAVMMADVIRRHRPGFWRGIDLRRMCVLARRYKSFPQLLAPAHTLSALAICLPAIFMNTAFGLTASGYFMLAERIVGMPLSLVSASIGDVFRQQMSQQFLAGEHCRREFISTFRKLTAIATPPFLVLQFFSPALFALIFGERWRVAGEYAQLMCPMFYLRFVSNPLSLTAIVAQKNGFEFLWHAGLLFSLAIVAAVYQFIQFDAKTFILIVVAVSSVFDLVILAASYRFACAGDLQEPGKRND